MQDIKKILVFVTARTEGSPALEQARRIAKATGAEIELVDVIGELPMTLRAPGFGYPDLLETLKKEAYEALEGAAAPIRHADGTPVSAKALYGKPFLEVTREVLRGEHDLVLLDARRDGSLHLWGTTAMRLFRVCPAPVWAVHPERSGACRKVLAAVDPLSGYDEENALNRRILEAALDVARLQQAELHVVHAWGEQEESPELLVRFEERMKAAAREALDALLAPYSDKIPAERVHLVAGRPAEGIHQVVRDENVDLLVMGTLVRTGIQGVLIGNTAEKLLGQVECSILALKPDGYRTPVELE